ncbi:MAG: hypothetical protein U9R29_03840 [Thermodesulfobacteriota bacterium]|nr:hypothetical protein [Thermodesulfobacteriota bacterium]
MSMKELWCDFDGVIVSNEMHNINTANIPPGEFADLVTKAYNDNPVTSATIRAVIADYKGQGFAVNIITGRKKSYLSATTEKILREHGIKVDQIFYYPEENSYVMAEYYDWKSSIIARATESHPQPAIRVIDDDKGLLLHLKDNLTADKLQLTHYEFYPDGREMMVQI